MAFVFSEKPDGRLSANSALGPRVEYDMLKK